MKCQIYKAKDGYRWRMISSNGNIVAESGEPYTRPYDCKKAAGNLAMRIVVEGVDFVEPKRRVSL